MSNLITKKNRTKPRPKKVYQCRYRLNGRSKSQEFNAQNDKAALRYAGFNAEGEPIGAGGGLLQRRLPKGAKITGLFPTGKAAKK